MKEMESAIKKVFSLQALLLFYFLLLQEVWGRGLEDGRGQVADGATTCSTKHFFLYIFTIIPKCKRFLYSCLLVTYLSSCFTSSVLDKKLLERGCRLAKQSRGC